MSHYLFSIKSAIIAFPIVAFFFTIPFILVQYHKYGSIHKFRTFIIYSFILYLMTVYFLVILPLPPFDEVVYQEGMLRLIPFQFLIDFLSESPFLWNDPSTYIKSLLHPSFYTVIFNIFMTIPFGMYLRYYFKCDFKNTCFYGFFFSLFLEVTQLTGLYFIYPYPYRIFDVDDLIMNTLGGALGYFIMRLFLQFLPTRDLIDQESLELGEKVSGFRRVTLFCFDFFLYMIGNVILLLWQASRWWFLLWFVFYYILYPYIKNGKTLGGKFLNVRLDYQRYSFLCRILRPIFLLSYYIIIPILLVFSYLSFVYRLHPEVLFWIFNAIFIIIFFSLFYLIHILFLCKKRKMFYDSWFFVEYQSTIR